jgi:antitoxin HigA-1
MNSFSEGSVMPRRTGQLKNSPSISSAFPHFERALLDWALRRFDDPYDVWRVARAVETAFAELAKLIGESVAPPDSMGDSPATRDAGPCPPHPGALLRESAAALPQTKPELAELLGMSRQHLHDLMAGRKPISPEVAVRLGKLFGNGGGLWLRMQAAHDLWKAEREVDVSKIPTLAA